MKPSRYKHFSSNLELYREVLRSQLDKLVSGHRRAVESADDNRIRVRAAVVTYCDFIDESPHGFRMVFDSAVTSAPTIRWHIERAIALHREGRIRGAARKVASISGELGASQPVWSASATSLRDIGSGQAILKQDAIETTAALWWGGLACVPFELFSADGSAA